MSNLQRAWSDSIESISIEDVMEAISEIQEVDDEHGAFWVGIFEEDEYVLEVDKNLNLVGEFGSESDEQIEFKAESWEEVEKLYRLFLDGHIEAVKKIMEKR
ncbi:hypothetical protein [Telluribacter humicola]|uniref:hypothetical protein n=1 Tax=Telluribacter humicola TaxID=1720261 RepID=UPI001A973A2D|nr:hypothetical protein [Telluribacter humicola]